MPDCKVFYVAESPPGNSLGFFYNPPPALGYSATLRNGLFQLLGIRQKTPLLGLEEFRDVRKLFLSDAVKCRCDKGRRSHVPKPVATNCGKLWIRRELELINPNKICVLGNSAIWALSSVEGFEKLADYRSGTDCGKIVNLNGRPILIWVFPGDRTAGFSARRRDVFRRFADDP